LSLTLALGQAVLGWGLITVLRSGTLLLFLLVLASVRLGHRVVSDSSRLVERDTK
jgi:hypothetical protein